MMIVPAILDHDLADLTAKVLAIAQTVERED